MDSQPGGIDDAPHVLVVDDEFLVAILFEDALKERGFRVTVCHSGADALAVQDTDPAAAVVTDLRMPGMNGMELLRRLRERWPEIPVLVVSGWLGESGSSHQESPSTGYMAKPVSPRAVAERLSTMLGE